MKDIYELLNDIDIDEKELEEIEASEIEKEKVKRNVKQSIRTKKKMKSWKKGVAVASILVGLSVATLGIGFPTYAGGLPIVGDIFRFIDNGRTGLYENYKADAEKKTGLHNNYQQYATVLNMTKERNGIKITINNAIFDGKTVSINYSIESNRDLGKNPSTLDFLTIKGAGAQSGSNEIIKVADRKYKGLIKTSSDLVSNKGTKVNVEWSIQSINILETEEEIKGDWNFNINLKGIENKEKLIRGSAEKDGVKVNMERMEITPMSFILYYNQEVAQEIRGVWDGVDVDLKVRDDIGNQYYGEGNGGSGEDPYNFNWSETFQQLNENATKLIITPYVNLRIHTPENYGSVTIVGGEVKERFVPRRLGGNKGIALDDIVIDLKK
ncbi:DUF4179 domain-containing protein [Bacillus wiedmannii]|uniref:Anti-sigma factor n=1 Tax=Bacillus wiedmannii TaxID=1890302 RepID=A0ABD6TJK5_9BACI|nr:DUF4179 domain-containing protein [Bacillus wiedmannii]PEA77824.1 anti-sigma factor [Bacillus wiedmannii]PEG08886.1 anti-sigma factor [Bacillus wiedmannii]PEI80814.1 anti-sigma factor [Bacillus wiedmannii]PEJ50631.1 anti-sigma factor [Bacillus wiedmannii]PEL38765.1 anti-sigma factor [Bacillus wiedmannii]